MLTPTEVHFLVGLLTIDSRRGNVQSPSESTCTQIERNQEVLAKYFAGMYRSHAILKHLRSLVSASILVSCGDLQLQ